MLKKFILQICTFFIIFVLSFGTIQNPYTSNYIENIKRESITVSTFNDPLFIELKQYAEKHNKAPINAVVDKVWKAIPGLNGLEVDIEASYEKMRKDGNFSESKVVYKQVQPEIKLSDLPPVPIYRGNPEKQMVTLLVNVAWGNEYLPSMLKIMQAHNVKSTFFLDGSWTKKNPTLAKMIIDEGHEIGNHAYSHPDMKKLSNGRISDEIKKTNEVIKATLDVTPKWFAPPSGSFRQDVVDIAKKMDMYTILWTVDTVDWRNPEPSAMVTRVLQKVEPGAMILMHPTASSTGGLEQLITGLKAKGYQISTVTNLLSEERTGVPSETLESY
ncbi:polysaccharide deacetylase family protein [Anaerobacillus isosaccharinicus]|uniref:Polysaccharide deacetylase family protein n=1 Tax=Anaerobacillus isosaccharinicus TaxID=1532552 RepID=A0A1S2M907_9BACI|nr:polysaccharide deacetylase family protein [Anaerobacillus isosaccharinicus]MBA5587285.1 polysaccharide deacetylase family protein [Anaerobacillus isosaccharinicus]QOY34523.1 polysaccharide deacetylase family protein [Anaerobacillus isosaccharinicus]